MSLTRTTSEFDASLQKLVGQTLFFYDPVRAWELGTLFSYKRDPRSGLVGTFKRKSDGEQVERSLRPDHIYCHTPGNERNNPDNLLALSELHHSLLINVLRIRHADDNVYTYLGDLVIAINPFKFTIPYYSDHMMGEYSSYIGQSEIPFSTGTTAGPYTQFLRPHAWAVAHRAYVEMLQTNKKNHSVVISGESGAGKTETCKLLLKYLVHISGRKLREEYAVSSTSAIHGSPTSEKTDFMYASPTSLVGIENASLHSAPSFRRGGPLAPSPSSPNGFEISGQQLLMNASLAYNSNNPIMMGSFAESPSFAFTSTMNVVITRELIDQREAHAAVINKRVQQADPILEAFGNAKTARNDNSSRFGKFMEVQFDDLGSLLGMRVTPFLLEKSRVVHCGKDERSYHCFYQLLAGGGPALLSSLRLKRARDYPNLDKGNCLIIRGVDDAREFQTLVQAMTDVGLSEEERGMVWKVLAAVLHLQTVDFEEHRVTGVAELGIEARGTCEFVAGELLGLREPSSLGECLVTTATYVKQEKITKALTVKKARDQRDSLSKYLYAKLFYWLVQRINEATMANSHAVTSWIGLLDIFGFEDMATNSFEQLCINLTNEVLQRNYTRAIFDKDIEDMRNEGISVEAVKYKDNAQCIELLQGPKNSILSFLDDASTLDIERAQTNPNLTFLHRVTQEHRPDYQTQPQKGTKSVLDRGGVGGTAVGGVGEGGGGGGKEQPSSASDYFLRGKLDDDSFTIRHYAGDVKYKVDSFVEKNIEVLKESTQLALLTTKSEMFKNIILTEEDSVGLLANSGGGGGGGASNGGPSSPNDGRGGVGKRTAAATFRKSLNLLRDLLAMSVNHWVRCLRPHTLRQPGLFDGKVMLEQLVATGVLETVAQRQRNFPFRLRHTEFLDRFGVIAFAALRKRRVRMAANDKCNTVLVTAGVSGEKDAQVGSYKVFLSSKARQGLEDKRVAVLDGFVVTLQRYAHHFLSKEIVCFLLLRRSTIFVQRHYRVKLRIRRAVRLYYEAIWRRMEEEMAEARRHIYVKETRNRTLVEAAMVRKTEELYNMFRRQLAPLVAAVLVNTQLVESHRRIDIENQSRDERRTLEHAFAEELNLAEKREQQRLTREAEERRNARQYLFDAYEEGSAFIREDEASARHTIHSHISPIVEQIKRDAADIKEQMAHRDRLLAVLEAERATELQRIAKAEEERIAAEEELWRRHIGEEAYKKDLAFLISTAGLTAEQCKEHLRGFYASRAATAVVSGSVLGSRGRSLQDDGRAVRGSVARPLSHGLGGVTSYREYASFMREAYDRHAVSHTCSRYGSSTGMQQGNGEMGRAAFSPANDPSFDIADEDFDEAVLSGMTLEEVVRMRSKNTMPQSSSYSSQRDQQQGLAVGRNSPPHAYAHQDGGKGMPSYHQSELRHEPPDGTAGLLDTNYRSHQSYIHRHHQQHRQRSSREDIGQLMMLEGEGERSPLRPIRSSSHAVQNCDPEDLRRATANSGKELAQSTSSTLASAALNSHRNSDSLALCGGWDTTQRLRQLEQREEESARFQGREGAMPPPSPSIRSLAHKACGSSLAVPSHVMYTDPSEAHRMFRPSIDEAISRYPRQRSTAVSSANSAPTDCLRSSDPHYAGVGRAHHTPRPALTGRGDDGPLHGNTVVSAVEAFLQRSQQRGQAAPNPTVERSLMGVTSQRSKHSPATPIPRTATNRYKEDDDFDEAAWIKR